MTRIKLCGIRNEKDIETINELKPEYVGFVFVKNSKRFVTIEEVKKLKEKLDGQIMAVGVFADYESEQITEIWEQGYIDVIQLHGKEDDIYVKKVKENTGSTIIQAFQIETKADIDRANVSSADYVLLDSGGGTGKVFDWNLLHGMKREYFLAGGLSANNVRDAVEKLQPFCVDVSSSIETNGTKDKGKMKRFVEEVRGREKEK